MRKLFWTLLLAALLALPAAAFDDVPEDHWARDAIAWAYENGYVSGTSAAAFSPGASISRQQVWMILARLSGGAPADMAAARAWAVESGISDGTAPGGAHFGGSVGGSRRNGLGHRAYSPISSARARNSPV